MPSVISWQLLSDRGGARARACWFTISAESGRRALYRPWPDFELTRSVDTIAGANRHQLCSIVIDSCITLCSPKIVVSVTRREAVEASLVGAKRTAAKKTGVILWALRSLEDPSLVSS